MNMGALRFHGPHDLRLETLPRPTPAPDRVIVNVEASGVCGSDHHFLDGSLRPGRVPVTLGHETAGRVAASDDPAWETGAEVVVALTAGCELCRRCLAGRPNLCERSALVGIDVDGGWAEAVATDGRSLVRRPPGMAPEVAAAAPDAGAAAYHAVMRRGDIGAGDAVVIIGIGAMGSFAVQFAKLAGAAPIIAVDTDPGALDRAGLLGADELIPVEAGLSIGRAVRILTDGGADAAIECVGAATAIDAAVKSLRPGGRAVAAGAGTTPVTTVPPVLWSTKEVELRGSYGSLPGDIERVLDWLADGTLQPPAVRPLALEEAGPAILDMAGRPGRGGLRIMVCP